MRRILFLLAVLVLFSSPSWAANKIQSFTVVQLGQWLTSVQGQPDGKVAKELQSTALTERVSATQLAQWQSTLPGRHSHDALTAVADASMLLPPPAAEVPTDPAPNGQIQNAILARANDYATQTFAKLPDFTATRTTGHFEDAPSSESLSFNRSASFMGGGVTASQAHTSVVAAQPVHNIGESTLPVSYHDGAEMRGVEKVDAAAVNRAQPGFDTAGEFGPMLFILLNDATHGAAEWGYWQQSPQGKLAVFTYAVTDGQSTYGVAFKHGSREDKLFSSYHGEIAIDPVTGAVLRFTAVANAIRSQDVVGAAISIDFGPITLGAKTCICPIHAVATLKTVPGSGGVKTQVNDAVFTDYHLMSADPAPTHP